MTKNRKLPSKNAENQTIPISVRCYVKNNSSDVIDDDWKNSNKYNRINYNSSTVLVFDTETTSDQYQNLLFGSCGVWKNDSLKEFYMFYADDLKKSDVDTITIFAKKHNYSVLSRNEFVGRVFYPNVFKARAKCIGFNLPFDLSRLAIHFAEARGKKFQGGFSLKLSKNPSLPDIRIKSINSKASFIEFTRPSPKTKSDRKKPTYKGYFLDLKTLTFTLTNESYSLKRALEDFECSPKSDAEEHGIINEKYLEYNVNDTVVTHELYQKATLRYKNYMLSKDVNYLYSPASIGKAYLEKIGIEKFFKKNQDFPEKILGYTMMSYYGGRTEVHMRKNPVRASYVDFTSMYPTIFVLLGMWNFLISDKIIHSHTQKETQEFIDRITLDDINKKQTWKNLTTICKIIPNNDILPVRSTYDPNGTATNIGINYLKSEDDTALWYALPDIIASKILSGKTPKIEDAITFYPESIQKGVQDIEILEGIPLKSGEDFIKKLIEERIRIKLEIKSKQKTNSDYKNSDEEKQDDITQNVLKIIANATSYGIFIQINTSHEGKQNKVTAYGIDEFETNAERVESPAEYFNPTMSVFLTAGSRLILASAEILTKQNNGDVFYFDTDSIFVTPSHVDLVKKFFKSLNPYDTDVEMFKIEEDKKHHELHDKLFYGISAKRYVLYDRDTKVNEFTIYKYSAHGLGHLLNPFPNKTKKTEEKENWHETIWHDILKINDSPQKEDEILVEKYKDSYAISQLTISTAEILGRFKKFNKRKSYKNKIKPFNFSSVGTGWKRDPETKEPVIPFLPYVDEKKRREIAYMRFVDYKTGKEYPNKESPDTEEFWKPLVEVIKDYTRHKESKSKGDTGKLERKHLVINKLSVRYIGKESNELEESDIVGVTDENYTKYVNVKEIILGLDVYKDHKEIGLSKSNLFELQKKARNGEKLHLHKKTLERILNHIKIKL